MHAERIITYVHTCTHTHMFVYMYIVLPRDKIGPMLCVCIYAVCVYVCTRAHTSQRLTAHAYNARIHSHTVHMHIYTYTHTWQSPPSPMDLKHTPQSGNVSLPSSPDHGHVAPLLPPKSCPHKVTLVLDLDETLVGVTLLLPRRKLAFRRM
jgi:hypothetical protein